MARAEKNEQIREERQAAILKEARRLFVQRGLSATKISDIAAAAGLSHGLVYHYFPTKDAIYEAIVARAIEPVLEATAAARTGSGSATDRLRALTVELLRTVEQEPDTMVLIVQATCTSTPSHVDALIADFGEKIFGNLVALLVEGQRAGEVADADPEEIAFLYFAAVQGIALTLAMPRRRQLGLPKPESLLRFITA